MSAAPWKSNFPPDLQERLRPIGAPSDNEETKRADLMSTFEADPALAAYRVPGLLGAYLRNRWLQEQFSPTASATAADLLDHYLEEAVDHVGPELATAAAQALAARQLARPLGPPCREFKPYLRARYPAKNSGRPCPLDQPRPGGSSGNGTG